MAEKDKPDEKIEVRDGDGVEVSVGGNVGGSLTVAGRDVINVVVNRINAVLPPWLQIGVTTLIGLVALVLLAVALVLYWVIPRPPEPPSPTPENEALAVVGQADLAITALAIDQEGDHGTLWTGVESGTGHSLHRLEVADGENADIKHVLDMPAEIIGIVVDCKGTLWLLSEEGALAYRPETGEQETLLNIRTTDGWLRKNTTFTVASRCLDDGTAEVWLAREGVHTLRYSGDYPSFEDIEFVSEEDDDIFQATQKNELGDVRALAYVPEDETLWVGDTIGKILSISFRGVHPPEVRHAFDTTVWSLSTSSDGSDLWAGTSEFLVSVKDGEQIGLLPDGRALVVAAGEPWVWAGDRCSELTPDCAPLVVPIQGQVHRVDLGDRLEVRAIAIAPGGAVWIGTEAGLILYDGPWR